MSKKEKTNLVLGFLTVIILALIFWLIGGKNVFVNDSAVIAALVTLIFVTVFSLVIDHFTYHPAIEKEEAGRKIYPKEQRIFWLKMNFVLLISMVAVYFLVNFILSGTLTGGQFGYLFGFVLLVIMILRIPQYRSKLTTTEKST